MPAPAMTRGRAPAAQAARIGPNPTKRVTLVSNQENTQFRIALFSESGPGQALRWQSVGKGKFLSVVVDPRYRYEVEADPDGYRPKRLTTTKPPTSELRFTFTLSDRVGPEPARRTAASQGRSAQAGVPSCWAVIVGIA